MNLNCTLLQRLQDERHNSKLKFEWCTTNKRRIVSTSVQIPLTNHSCKTRNFETIHFITTKL